MTTVPPPDAGAAILVAALGGVWQIAPDGTTTQLVRGPTAYVIDDTMGGLLFQIDRGRRRHDWAWDTRVWWLP